MNQRVEHHFRVADFGRSAGLIGLAVALFAGLFLLSSPPAHASIASTKAMADGAVRTEYRVGPLNVTPGQNRISYNPIKASERPAVNGWITRIQPNLVYADGSIPLSSKVMFHHGVWLNLSRKDATSGGQERFYATGEEKTNMDLPPGYGYRYKKSDVWLLNHMIHNLTPEKMTLYISYTIDFIPDSAPQAASIQPVRPIWMDVDNGSIYPVFDVHRGEGGADGEFTYPQDADNPYKNGKQKNEWTVDRDGVLVGTTGHVHTGGLSTNLYLRREGASYTGPTCDAPPNRTKRLKGFANSVKKLKKKRAKLAKAVKPGKLKQLKRKMSATKFKQVTRKKRKALNRAKRATKKKIGLQRRFKAKVNAEQKAYRTCVDSHPVVDGNRVHLFDSEAKYFRPEEGPVSWDVAMMSTKPDWRVAVKKGDTLELQTTYETKMASWYESMGINVVYMADETNGDDPYVTKVDGEGVINHGHYDENNDHGGTTPVVGPDPTNLPSSTAALSDPLIIGGYSYEAGDFRIPGAAGRPPVIQKGQSLTFKLSGADQSTETWHSLTSCKSPCNKSTGIAYPIADGDFQFDSGQLGKGGPPTVNRDTWSTPADLPVGTHTYFCRIHPLMRGAVRVVDNK